MKQGVPAWQGHPGSIPAEGPRPGVVGVPLAGAGVPVMDPISETDSGCRGKLSDGARCRKGTSALCKEHQHL